MKRTYEKPTLVKRDAVTANIVVWLANGGASGQDDARRHGGYLS